MSILIDIRHVVDGGLLTNFLMNLNAAITGLFTTFYRYVGFFHKIPGTVPANIMAIFTKLLGCSSRPISAVTIRMYFFDLGN